MRTITMFNRVTVDGYFAAPDGNLNWVVQEEALDRAAAEGMASTDTILFGRRTYEMFERFWRAVAEHDSPTAPDPHADRRTEGLRTMALWIHDAHKIVWSRTLGNVTWKNARLVRDFDPGAVEAMKREDGGNMIVFGSGSIVSLLTAHRLIDDYRFVVNPTILGDGQSMIRGLTESIRVELLETKAYPSGNVLLRYGIRG